MKTPSHEHQEAVRDYWLAAGYAAAATADTATTADGDAHGSAEMAHDRAAAAALKARNAAAWAYYAAVGGGGYASSIEAMDEAIRQHEAASARHAHARAAYWAAQAQAQD